MQSIIMERPIINNFQERDSSYDQYIDFLSEKGVTLNPYLYPAFFHLKNGLSYSGIKTCKKIGKRQILITVPVQMTLSSIKAFQENQLVQIFKERFFYEAQEHYFLEDRILVVYSLYCLKNKPSSLWGTMVRNLPRNIDILPFWKQQQVNDFRDSTIRTAVQLQQRNFQQQWKQFEQLKSHYSIFDSQYFSKDYYKWVYIHVISRCFGSFLSSAYFVPLCQLFNHNCVTVNYRCVKRINPMNNIKQRITCQNTASQDNQKFSTESMQPCFSNQNDCDQKSENSESSCSYSSQEYIEQGDFDYISVLGYQNSWNYKTCFKLKDSQIKQIENKINALNDFIDNKLEWRKSITIVFVSQIIQKLKIIQNQFKAGRRQFKKAVQDLNFIENMCTQFLQRVQNFYNSIGIAYIKKNNLNKNKKMKNKFNLQKLQQSDKVQNQQGQQKSEKGQICQQECPQNKGQYTHFVLETRKKCQFNQGQQVFFSYGKLSNRTLLMRYGFCLENNKHQHVWLRVCLMKNLKCYPDTVSRLEEKGLPLVQKLKIKDRKMSYELLLLIRANQWRLTHNSLEQLFEPADTSILQNTIDFLKEQLQKNHGQQQSLYDQIGYHQYFKRVYQNQKRRILRRQIDLLKAKIM